MTPDELRARLNGRELDVDVERRVFGNIEIREMGFDSRLVAVTHPVPKMVPRYSTDIAAAWLVLDQVRDRGLWDAFLLALEDEAALDRYGMRGDGCLDTDIGDLLDGTPVPLKICRAAMKVCS